MQHDWAASSYRSFQQKTELVWVEQLFMKRTSSDAVDMTEHSFWQQFKQLPALVAQLKQGSVRQLKNLVRATLPYCRTVQHFKTVLAFIEGRRELRSLCELVKHAWEDFGWQRLVRLELTKRGPVTAWWFRAHRAEYELLLSLYPYEGMLSTYIRTMLRRFA